MCFLLWPSYKPSFFVGQPTCPVGALTEVVGFFKSPPVCPHGIMCFLLWPSYESSASSDSLHRRHDTSQLFRLMRLLSQPQVCSHVWLRVLSVFESGLLSTPMRRLEAYYQTLGIPARR